MNKKLIAIITVIVLFLTQLAFVSADESELRSELKDLKQYVGSFGDVSYKLRDNVVEINADIKNKLEKHWDKNSFSISMDKGSFKKLSEEQLLDQDTIYVDLTEKKGVKLSKITLRKDETVDMQFEKAKPEEIFDYLDIPKQIVKLDNNNIRMSEDKSISSEFFSDYHRINFNNTVLVNNSYAKSVANGYIEIISPAIIGQLNQSNYEVGFIGHVYSNIEITSNFKASKTYRVKIAEYGVDCEVGEAVLGIYIIVRAGGSINVVMEFEQEAWIDMGVRGDCSFYIPTSVDTYDWTHAWFWLDVTSINATVWTSVGINPRAAVTIMDWDLVTLDPEAGVLGRMDYSNGSYRLRGWGYVDIDATILNDEYQIYYKEWLLFDEWF